MRSVLILLFFTLPAATYGFVAINKPLPYLTSRVIFPVQPGKSITLDWPKQGYAAIGSIEDGLLSKSPGSEIPRPTASIAKIVTALAVLEKRPFNGSEQGAVITLDQTDVDFYNDSISMDGSNVPIVYGEQITELQALEAMFLPSANNIADTMAYWAFGSIDSYVTYANSMVKGWGLSSTVIADASGVSQRTISTPSDLIVLGQRILKNPILQSVASKKTAEIPIAGTIANTNILLGTDGIIGIKTGHSNDAGAGLLFAAKYPINSTHTTTIIGVVQAVSTVQESFSSAQALLASAKKGFVMTTVIKAGEKVGEITSEWGGKTTVYAEQDLLAYGWSGSKMKPSILLQTNKTSIAANEHVGTASVQSDGNTYTVQVAANKKIPAASLLWRLTHYF